MVSRLVNMSKKNIVLKHLISLFCRCVFFVVSFWNEMTGFLRNIGLGAKTYEKLKKTKNLYQGERCFIIATGPSLTIADLELLKDEYTFGMNSIIKVYGQTDFRPTFYGIQDHLVYQAMEKEILSVYENSENVFVADRIKWHSKIGKEWYVFPLNMSYHAYKRWFKDEFFVKFSDNAYRRIYSGFSITYSLIEIAVYMGFKEIYLIGADCSFDKSKKLHFAEHGVVDKSIDTAQQRMLVAYEEVKNYADSHNIKIYNATRGGELEIFERVELESVL